MSFNVIYKGNISELHGLNNLKGNIDAGLIGLNNGNI